MSVTILGNYLSPQVRKVLALLHQFQIKYEIDPVFPEFASSEFRNFLVGGSEQNEKPEMLIPSLCVTENNSTRIFVGSPRICSEFLQSNNEDSEQLQIENALEELVMKKVWFQKSIRPLVLKEKVQQYELDQVEETLRRELNGLLMSSSSSSSSSSSKVKIGFGIAAYFRQLELLKYDVFGDLIEREKFPEFWNSMKHLMHEREEMKSLRKFEEISAKNPPASHITFLKAEGAPISETYRFSRNPTPSIWQAPFVKRY